MTDNTTIRRALGLVKLRWFAVGGLLVGIVFFSKILRVPVEVNILYAVAAILAVYNGILFLLLSRFTRKSDSVAYEIIEKIIKFQVYADLCILIVLLHYSGGIESPFILFLIINEAIAAVFLSGRQKYCHVILTALLLGIMILFEYLEVISHHCLKVHVQNCSFQDAGYVWGTYLAITVLLYTVVYLIGYFSSSSKNVEKADNQLIEKDRVKDEYVANLAHDITGHLATIQSCLGVVLTGDLDEQSSEFANRAFERTKKLTNFTKKLKKLTDIKLVDDVKKSEFSLVATILRIIDSVMSEAEKKSIKINCRISDTPEKIYGVESYIAELLETLLNNAVKYTPENGEVTISVTSKLDTACLRISDTGIGIPADQQAKMFEDYKASNITDADESCPGLGLIMSRYIVEAHGGTIAVESRDQQGTTFTIKLPISTP